MIPNRSHCLARFLVSLCLFGLTLASADQREDSIERAKQHLKQSNQQPLVSAVCIVVIGYEGNLPLFKDGVIPPPQNGTGLAVPVDKGGFFLTAAHSVVADRDMYVMGNFSGKLEAHKAEIIFRGDPSGAQQDFALLRVQATLPFCFEFADSLPRKNATLYAIVRSNNKPALAEANCLYDPSAFDAHNTTTIMSNLPVVGGDSGGPLLTPDLKLLGLTSRGANSLWGTFTLSCCPAPSLIGRLIEEAKVKPANVAK